MTVLINVETQAIVVNDIELNPRDAEKLRDALTQALGLLKSLPQRGVSEGSAQRYVPLYLEKEVDLLLNAGEKIRAIKLVRAETGWGLKESKWAVDDRKAQLNRHPF